MEPLLIHLFWSSGRNSSGDLALSSLSYLFLISVILQEEPCLGSCCSAFLFSVIYWRLALFLVWVVKLSSRSSFSLNCSEMHHVHTLTSKTMRNSLNNLFIVTNQNLRITITFYKITKRTCNCHYSWDYIFHKFSLWVPVSGVDRWFSNLVYSEWRIEGLCSWSLAES